MSGAKSSNRDMDRCMGSCRHRGKNESVIGAWVRELGKVQRQW